MPCEPLGDDSPGGGAASAAGLALGHLAISASLTWKLAAICDGGRPSCRCSRTMSQLTARPPPPAPAHEYKGASNGTSARIQSLARRIGDRILPPLVYAEATESGRLWPISPMPRKSSVTDLIGRRPACVSPKNCGPDVRAVAILRFARPEACRLPACVATFFADSYPVASGNCRSFVISGPA